MTNIAVAQVARQYSFSTSSALGHESKLYNHIYARVHYRHAAPTPHHYLWGAVADLVYSNVASLVHHTDLTA